MEGLQMTATKQVGNLVIFLVGFYVKDVQLFLNSTFDKYYMHTHIVYSTELKQETVIFTEPKTFSWSSVSQQVFINTT